MTTHVFFAHVVLAIDARIFAPPKATANLLIEINSKALKAGGKEKHFRASALTELQEVELAKKIGKTAALDDLKSEPEFSKLPVQRFVDFNLTHTPTYISIRAPFEQSFPEWFHRVAAGRE
jgi:hypothetical protein